MELGLSLGDATPSNITAAAGATVPNTTTTETTTTTTVGVNMSLGFCMDLGMNQSNETSHQHMDKSHAQDDEAGGDESDDDDGDEDEQILKENEGAKDVSISSQRVPLKNPPVQLDLLPSDPVPRHPSFPWFSNNGNSEGGSCANVKRPPVGMEEATSSFRLEFMGFGRNRIGSDNKRGFEIGNDTVVVERASSRASDEDENGMSRKKLRLSKEQSAYLEESFKEHSTLNPKQKLALAEQLNLRPRQVEVWFQNRRARTKLKQTEVDFEYLKRCCETLTDENRRLHKELQELRALKSTSNPFYMQLPATTLTMCPSCERVATTSPPLPSTTTTPLNHSTKPVPLIFPVGRAPPSSNSHHQPATPS
ncbi:hypothetical protein E3N88_13976 [Mikania micrantha]|uniref:Homeobox domain-containing protein n=1 Tax=Mikania micrantha TaxID=192012 RepID=A0A5N6P2R8_9ASTR|nr:hypothetical protein E3N88_13976 [Mikania micrantha]